MRDYQAEQLMKEPDKPIPDSVRLLKDEDIDRWGFLFYVSYFTVAYIYNYTLKCQFKRMVKVFVVKWTVWSCVNGILYLNPI